MDVDTVMYSGRQLDELSRLAVAKGVTVLISDWFIVHRGEDEFDDNFELLFESDSHRQVLQFLLQLPVSEVSGSTTR